MVSNHPDEGREFIEGPAPKFELLPKNLQNILLRKKTEVVFDQLSFFVKLQNWNFFELQGVRQLLVLVNIDADHLDLAILANVTQNGF